MKSRLARLGVLAVALAAVVVVGALRMRPSPSPQAALAQRSRALHDEALSPRFEALKPLHAPLSTPRPGDWLAEHPQGGESVAAYLAGSPTRATAERRTLYLLPIGDFTPAQREVVDATADFLARFYQLKVVTLEALPASAIPPEATRRHPTGGQLQVNAGTLMDKVLLPRRPEDAMALLALTALDLYPADDWNFVFGEASLEDRVGVWSLYRNGDPEKDARRFLERTLKTAAHELGHQFSLQHCLAFSCLMNGSNHLEEADRQPLTLCPACLQKLAWNTGFDAQKRARELEAFDRAHGLEEAAALEAATEKVLAGFDAGAGP